jgi:hypothetical protein
MNGVMPDVGQIAPVNVFWQVRPLGRSAAQKYQTFAQLRPIMFVGGDRRDLHWQGRPPPVFAVSTIGGQG